MTLSAPAMGDEEFDAYCQRYAGCRLESTAEGDIIIQPPTGAETGFRNTSIGRQLANWAENTRGYVSDSSSGFKLPGGARRSPDAAWISRDRFRNGQRPEFIVELLSPTDRPRVVREKMYEWIENGVEPGWMINARTRSVAIFRPGQEPEIRTAIQEIAGEGPVAGFVLDLRPVWRDYTAD